MTQVAARPIRESHCPLAYAYGECYVLAQSEALGERARLELGLRAEPLRYETFAELRNAVANATAPLLLVTAEESGGGTGLCRRLRAHGLHAPLLAIALKPNASLEAALLEAGADDVAALADAGAVARAAFALQRCSQRDYRLEVVTGVDFDCSRRAVCAPDGLVKLTPATNDLFGLLATNAEQWVPQDQLLHCLDLRLLGDAASAFIRQRAQSLRKALSGSGVEVSFSTRLGVRLARRR